MKKCLDCPKDITGTHSRTVRCGPCQHRRDLAGKAKNKRLKNRTGRVCEDCPAGIEHLHALRRRCDECQRKLKNKRLRDWRKNNPDKAASHDRRRREEKQRQAKERYASDPIYRQKLLDRVGARYRELGRAYRKVEIIKFLVERDGLVCSYCGLLIEDPFDGRRVHVDHRIPRVKGGSSEVDNLQLLHALCNTRKGGQ